MVNLFGISEFEFSNKIDLNIQINDEDLLFDTNEWGYHVKSYKFFMYFFGLDKLNFEM